MTNSINIQELTEKIANQIKNSSNENKEVKDNNIQEINEKNFEKLIELEKLNKKMKQEDDKESNITPNIKKCLKEPFIIFILFIILSHTTFTNLITNMPIACIRDNQILQIIIKGMIMSILFYFTKSLLD